MKIGSYKTLRKKQSKIMEDAKDKNNFDAIRLIAALMVIFSHSFPLTGLAVNTNEPLALITGNNDFGHLGISVFLFVSGYLICNSLRKNSAPVQFFKKRFLRMIPALGILILIAIFIVGPIFTTLSIKEYFSLKGTWIYFENIILFRPQYTLPGVFENCPKSGIVDGSLWTLAYEFLFYAALFCLFTIVKQTKHIAVIGIILFILSTVIMLRYETPITQNKYVIPFLQLSISNTLDLFNYFIAGVIMNCINIQKKYTPLLLAVGLILFSISFFKIILLNKILFFIAVPVITYSLAFSDKIKLNALTKYGDFSYGIYLYGFVIQQALISALVPKPLNVYLFFMITACFSYFFGFLSWRFVERPALQFKYN